MRSAIVALALAASMFGGELLAESSSLPGAWDDFGAFGDDTRDEFHGEASTGGTSGADSAEGSESAASVDTAVVSCASAIPIADRHPAGVLIAQAYLGCAEGTIESLS